MVYQLLHHIPLDCSDPAPNSNKSAHGGLMVTSGQAGQPAPTIDQGRGGRSAGAARGNISVCVCVQNTEEDSWKDECVSVLFRRL